MSSLWAASSRMPRPSRSHWIAAPATKIDPSRAKAGPPRASQAAVVSRPWLDETRSVPVLKRRKARFRRCTFPCPLPSSPGRRGRPVDRRRHRRWDFDSQRVAVGHAEVAAAGPDFGQDPAGDPHEVEQFRVPVALVEVVEKGARRVGGVGRVDRTTRQPGDEPAVDRAGGQRSQPGPLGQPRIVLEHPAQLGPRESTGPREVRCGGGPSPRARPP